MEICTENVRKIESGDRENPGRCADTTVPRIRKESAGRIPNPFWFDLAFLEQEKFRDLRKAKTSRWQLPRLTCRLYLDQALPPLSTFHGGSPSVTFQNRQPSGS
jgi:hypothetical protein